MACLCKGSQIQKVDPSVNACLEKAREDYQYLHQPCVITVIVEVPAAGGGWGGVGGHQNGTIPKGSGGTTAALLDALKMMDGPSCYLQEIP